MKLLFHVKSGVYNLNKIHYYYFYYYQNTNRKPEGTKLCQIKTEFFTKTISESAIIFKRRTASWQSEHIFWCWFYLCSLVKWHFNIYFQEQDYTHNHSPDFALYNASLQKKQWMELLLLFLISIKREKTASFFCLKPPQTSSKINSCRFVLFSFLFPNEPVQSVHTKSNF